MMQNAGMENNSWPEAAICIKDKLLSKAVKNTTPEEKWVGNKVDLSNLKICGCSAYILTPSGKRKKLDTKSKRYIFVGYCSE